MEAININKNRPYCFSLPDRSHVNARDPEKERPWCDECDHFVDCQEAYKNRPKILTLHLKEVFFRQIQRGEKVFEYREFTDYWNKRIQHGRYDVIEICNGYPKRGDLNNRMWFKWNGWQTILMMKDPVTGELLCEGKQYFSISLKSPIAYPYQAMETGVCDS